MRKLRSILTAGLALTLSLGLTACGNNATEQPEDAEVEAKDKVLGPAVWVAQDDDSNLFLIGTVPYMQDNAEWETLAISSATNEANTFFFEYDPSDNAAMASTMLTQDLGFYSDGTTLADLLQPEDADKLRLVSEKTGIPFGRWINFKPWLAAMVLGADAAEQAGLNGDDLFIKDMTRQARIDRKTISYLTTPEARVRALADIPEDIQLRFLNRTVNRYDGLGAKMVATADNWQDGQLAPLLSDSVTLHTQMPSREYKEFLRARNKEWLEILDNFMQGQGDGVVFVSMPYLLSEEVNLQLMLIDRKYNVKRYYGAE